jgi:competence protein ComEA
VFFTPAERRLLALLVLLLSAGYALSGLAHLGLLAAVPAGGRGGAGGGQAPAASSGSPPDSSAAMGPECAVDAASAVGPESAVPPESAGRAGVSWPASLTLRADDAGPPSDTVPEPRAGRVTSDAQRASPLRDGYLDLNAADSLDLLELPGVGPTLAGRILALRRQRAGFQSVAELREVRGVGEKRYARLAELVRVDGDCRKQ